MKPLMEIDPNENLRRVIKDMIDSAPCKADENAWREHLGTLENLIEAVRYAKEVMDAWEETMLEAGIKPFYP